MKKILSIMILMCMAMMPSKAEETGVHRFGCFNVRYDNPKNGDTGEKKWSNRKEFVKKIVTDYDFDVVGMEEVIGNIKDTLTGKTQLQDLRDLLTDYADWAVEREGKKYEHNVIFYKKTKYELLDKGRFYINEHPETPGVGWKTDSKGILPRVLCWVKLKDKASGQEFYFCCTHVNYGAVDCGIRSGKLIGHRLKNIVGQTPVVLVGDFNMRRDDHELAYRGYASYFYDLALTTPENRCLPEKNPQIKATTTGWTTVLERTEGHEIDYIFYDHMTPLSRHIITEYYPELGRTVNPSDHYPVLGRFRIGEVNHPTVFCANNDESLQKALQNATMGDTICLAAGEYHITQSIKPECSLCIMGGFNSDYSDVTGKSVFIAENLTEPMISIPHYYNLELHDIVMQESCIQTNGQKLKLYNCSFLNNKPAPLGEVINSTVDSLLINGCVFAK